jgi:transcription elongation GreA/GreB family factor
MKKKQIISDILAHLEQELSAIKTAANNAHLAATDDQSVAETQYDTLAIEASYLAEGQSRRVEEIQQAKQAIEQLVIRTFDENTPISLSALVQLSQDNDDKLWFFIAPAAGGFRGVLNEQTYTVITPRSPMAKALIGKFVDDEVELMMGVNKRHNEIVAVY